MTAVEWLENEIIIKEIGVTPQWLLDAIKQAKAMEKEQIIKAVYDSMGTNIDPNMGRAEQYYNENYNK